VLTDDLKILLATNYAFVIKAQLFHWNVEGPDFGQLHKFFQKIYEDVYDSIDSTAEYIRILGEYTPGSFERFSELSLISGQTKIPRAQLMIEELLNDTQTLIDLLNRCFSSAENENQQGVADFIAGRIDAMGKHRWMLQSFLKLERA
jgi:starvation-inducible DNA-binding protein